MIIRPAVGGDFDCLLNLGEKMRRESLVNFPPIEEEKVAMFLKKSLDHPDMFMVCVAQDTEIIGMITSMLGEYSFCSAKRSVCDMLFVTAERRGALAAKKLIQKFIGWSQNVGANEAIMGVSTGIHPERTGRLFERLGFELMGHSYRMELNNV